MKSKPGKIQNNKEGTYRMIIDGHIHTVGGHCDSPAVFLQKSRAAGIIGGTVFNLYPEKYRNCPGYDQRWQARIDWILEYTSQIPGFLPFHFLDPTEADACRQIEDAAEKGIRGFKIICDHFPVCDYLKVIETIAATELPVMFHSGVLGNATCSSFFNRPIDFECLFKIPGLKFSLAHLGWPWCDEFIGIYGKFELARRTSPGKRAEMYIDLAPGTPGIYRAEAIRKLYCTGYPVRHKVFWGSDLTVNNYETDCAKWWLQNDIAIFEQITHDARTGNIPCWKLPPLEHIQEYAFSKVCKKFTKPKGKRS